MKQFLECGRIVSTHGVRGEVKAEVWMDSPQEMTALKTLYLEGGKTPLPNTCLGHNIGRILRTKMSGVLQVIDNLPRNRSPHTRNTHPFKFEISHNPFN